MNRKLFLIKNKQSFIALFVLLVMLFNACSDATDNNTNNFTPMGLYVDSSGNLAETDSGRTVVVADKNAKVVFYSDNLASNAQRVGLSFDDKSIIFFFERDQNFPTKILLSDSESSYKGVFTPYDPITQTFGLTLEQGGEKKTWSKIALSKDTLMQIRDDKALTPSQNLRMRNLYVASCIYKSLDNFITTDDTLQARAINWGAVGNFFKKPVVIQCIAIIATVYVTVGIAVTVTVLTGGAGAPVVIAVAGEVISGVLTGAIGIGAAIITDQVNKNSSQQSSSGEKGGGGGGGGGFSGGATVAVTGVSLNKTSVSLVVGSSETLLPTITPANATNKTVSWSSSNPAVASVASDGTVAGLNVGTATITVKTADGNKTATCSVNVIAVAVAVTGVSLNKTSVSLIVGNAETLIPTITPDNATDKTVSWSSSNAAVATVASDGTVIGLSVGTAAITVKTNNGNKTATCAVTVNPIIVTGVSLNKTSVSLVVGTEDNLVPTILPANVANKNVSWSSSNPAVATVSNSGLVTGVSVGTSTITVKTQDGNKTATCAVTVNPIRVSSVSLKSDTSLIEGGTETLYAEIDPPNATNKSVTWISSNPAVATVSNSGLVTGVSVGTATVTVKTQDGNHTAVCNVTVVTSAISVTGVSLNKTRTSLDVGGSVTLVATIAPSDATNQNVTWNSSEPTVATVSNSGTVTAVTTGTATITATTVDGGKTAACTITVISWDVYNESTWNEVVTRIKSGGNNKAYTITVTDNFCIPGVTANTFGSVTGITVTIIGDKEISLAAGSTGSLLYVGETQTVIIRDTDLKGHNANNASLVKIISNYSMSSSFTMKGNATVSGNSSTSKGAVNMEYGVFIMQDNASVSGNFDLGVYLYYNRFTMQDNASVSGNLGGGVRIFSYSFTMQDNASVSDNSGTGITIYEKCYFTMGGNATVSNNSSSGYGGGVFVSIDPRYTFIMQDNATISGNSVFGGIGGFGAGVYVDQGTFIMKGGTIYGNIGMPLGNNAGSHIGASLFVSDGTARYGDYSDILLRIDFGNAKYTNDTIIGRN